MSSCIDFFDLKFLIIFSPAKIYILMNELKYSFLQ